MFVFKLIINLFRGHIQMLREPQRPVGRGLPTPSVTYELYIKIYVKKYIIIHLFILVYFNYMVHSKWT